MPSSTALSQLFWRLHVSLVKPLRCWGTHWVYVFLLLGGGGGAAQRSAICRPVEHPMSRMQDKKLDARAQVHGLAAELLA